MPKPIYLFTGIYSYVAESFARSLDEAVNEDTNVYVNSPGGDVLAGWSMIGKLNERKTKSVAKVGGMAMSMAANMLLYFDEVEALDVSRIMFHRASMYTSTDEDKAFLKSVNEDLRKQMEAKIDSAQLKALKGVSIKDLFENEKRIDLFLTAAEAKKIGLVNKVVKLQPNQVKAFSDMSSPDAFNPSVVAAMFDEAGKEPKPVSVDPSKDNPIIVNSNPINKNTMTIEELRDKHPQVYAQAVEAGRADERDRVQAIMVYADADLTSVKAAIDSGKPLTAKQTQEFLVKLTAAGQLQNLAENAGKPAPVAQPATEADKQKEQDAKTLESVNSVRKLQGLEAFKELPDSYKTTVVA